MSVETACVVGLGKVGLPLAVQIASKGARVLGCDSNEAVVSLVNAGQAPFPGEEGLEKRLHQVVGAQRLTASTETPLAVRESQVVVILVPLLVDERGQPDFQPLDRAAAAVAEGLSPGTLVVLETTVPVGTTRHRLGKCLERSGLTLGRDLFLAYSPERVSSGRIFRDLATYPKIVGGIDEGSAQRAQAFYTQVLDAPVLVLRDAETAELAKLLEATYRDVNIALANEFARYAWAKGVDVAEAIRAANSQPYSHIHIPGVGVGGHCIPVYPYFLLQDDPSLRLTGLAREINDGMAAYAVGLLEETLGSLREKTVLILGWAYRENVKEATFTSAQRLYHALVSRGATVLVHDPLFSAAELAACGVGKVELAEAQAVDAIILQCYHREYQALDWGLFRRCQVVLDGRNALEAATILSHGRRYLGIGRKVST